MRRPAGFLGVLLLATGLAACSGNGRRPEVDDQSRHMREPDQPVREVVAGDTLYSIAWENGRDYRELAQWNGVEPPYLIKPGMRLRLYPPASGEVNSQPAAVSDSGRYRVVKGDTLYGIARRHGVSHKALARWNGIRPPYRIRPGQTLKLSGAGAGSSKPASRPIKTARSNSKQPVEASRGKVRWRWPTRGQVVARYTGTRQNKGIDIAGKSGQKILAAATGEVVYQGAGLRGYGRLVIIKHTDEYLSAYAHCDRIYVKEGDVLKIGTLIAGMGSSGTNRTKLHFEIRYRGNPVNPLKYLPRK